MADEHGNAIQWVDPHEGFEYLTDIVSISAAHQAEKLEACGLDPAVYADTVDPSFFIGEAIHAGINSGITAEGNVNMLQSLVQHRPARLDEPLTVRGRITTVTPVPRGRTIDTDVWFEDESGARVITARRRSLKPDPDKVGVHGAGERPPPVIENLSTLTHAGSHQLTPEQVISLPVYPELTEQQLERVAAAVVCAGRPIGSPNQYGATGGSRRPGACVGHDRER